MIAPTVQPNMQTKGKPTMKKLFALLLALVMLLSLAACGEPDESKAVNNEKPGTPTPTTQPDNKVELVTSYEGGGNSVDAFRLDFTYDNTYRAGTVTMTANDESVSGTFTCDENYNINHIDVDFSELEGGNAHFYINCTFDDAHRLLTAKMELKSDNGERLIYAGEYAYDDQDHTTYQRTERPGQLIYISKSTYNEAGQILRQETTTENSASYTSVTCYSYDAEGFMTSLWMEDGQGNLIEKMDFTRETVGDKIHYTCETGSNKLVIVQNKDHQLLLQERYSAGTLVIRIELEYNDAGQLIKQSQDTVPTNQSITNEYAYTASGRLASHTQKTTGQEAHIVSKTTFMTVEIPN
jgi:hypothetical protein